MKIDLESRAFGENGELIPSKETSPEEPTETVTAEESHTESESKESEKKDTEAPSSAENDDDEQKVPYSRLKTVVEQKRQAEREREEALRELESLRTERGQSRQSHKESGDEDPVYSRIKKLYGDNDTAREIYEIEVARRKDIESLAEQKAIEAIERRERSSQSEIETNERVIETEIEDLSLTLGRDLSPEEEDAVLEIADKYSPTGEDGKYLSGRPLPLDRAWEIYEMQQFSQAKSSKAARSRATAATSSRTESESVSDDSSRSDSDWKPNWGSWRSKLK